MKKQNGVVVFGIILGLFGCSSTSSRDSAQPAAVKQETGGDEDLDWALADIARRLPLDENHPLAKPQSNEDVVKILKIDQLNLFPKAIEYLKNVEDPESQALEAQIELAWGDSYLHLASVFQRLRGERVERLAALQADNADAKNSAKIETYSRSLEALDQRVKILSVLSKRHHERGSTLAQEVMAAMPEQYLGYRVMADYYRLVKNWEKFNAMMTKIEATNPESNGLRFLKGIAAYELDKDSDTASTWFREALVHDPDFVRAQAYLVVVQGDVQATLLELEKLEQLNANHQLANWAGGVIKREAAGEMPAP